MPLIFLDFSFINGTECNINNNDVPINDRIEPKQNIIDDILFNSDTYCNQYRKLKNENIDSNRHRISILGLQ